jgi:hypothetical protein
VEAAHGVVADVLGLLHFVRVEDFHRKLLLVREVHRVFHLGAGQGGRVGEDGEHPGAERLVGGEGEKGGIDAAGIGDQHASEPAEACFEFAFLFQ